MYSIKNGIAKTRKPYASIRNKGNNFSDQLVVL